jgi:[ribosomal protein S5]-alanine N-acetyltransferase
MSEGLISGSIALTTPRLRLQPVSAGDLDMLHDILVQKAVRKYLFDGRALSREEVAAMIASSRDFRARDGTGLWTMRMGSRPQAVIGFVGFWPFHEPPICELSYALDIRYWSRGLASEAGAAMLLYARERLGWRSVQASTNQGNAASIQVLKRLGFTETGIVPAQPAALTIFRRQL